MPEVASVAPASVPVAVSTAAQDHWSAALKLKGHEALYAVGYTILALTFTSLMRALSIDDPVMIGIPIVCAAWAAVTAFQWHRVRRTDPDVFWQLEVNSVAAATIRKQAPAAVGYQPPRPPPQAVQPPSSVDRALPLDEAIEMHSRAAYITRGVRMGELAIDLVIRGCRTNDASMQAEGLRVFREALILDRDPVTLFNYAQALRMTGRSSDAIPVVQEVLSITPGDPYAEALLSELRPPTLH